MSKRRNQEKNKIRTHVKDRRSTLPKELREQYEKEEARKARSKQEIEYMAQEAETEAKRDLKRRKFFEGIEYEINHGKAKQTANRKAKMNKEKEINEMLKQYLEEQGIDESNGGYRIRNGLIEIGYYDEEGKPVKIQFSEKTFLAMKKKEKEM